VSKNCTYSRQDSSIGVRSYLVLVAGKLYQSVQQHTGALREVMTGTVKGRFANVSVRIEGLENFREGLLLLTLTVLDTLNLAKKIPYLSRFPIETTQYDVCRGSHGLQQWKQPYRNGNQWV
jgi:hypothetical protein